MISIKFLDKDKNSLTVIDSFFDIRVKNKLSDTSTAQFTIPYNTETISKLKKNVRKVWNIVEIWVNLKWGWNIFTWIIRKTTIQGQYIVFDCLDLVSYYKSFAQENKKFWSYWKYSPWYPMSWRTRYEPCPYYDESISSIEHCWTWYTDTTTTEYNENYKWQINNMVTYYHNLRGINLFEIGKNETTDYIETDFKEKEKSFFDIIDNLAKNHWITRRANWYNLDIIWVFDEIQKWLRKYDYTDVIWSDIYDFKRIESLDSLLLNDKTDNYPSIEIEEPERYKYKVWQKKAIQINTQLDEWLTWYVWIITEINLKAEATKVIWKIKVDNEPRQKTDESLRGVLENLHNRVIKI